MKCKLLNYEQMAEKEQWYGEQVSRFLFVAGRGKPEVAVAAIVPLIVLDCIGLIMLLNNI